MRGRKPDVRPFEDLPAEEEVVRMIPMRPTALMGNAEAIKEWKRIAAVLLRVGRWESADESFVISYCETYSVFRGCGEELRAQLREGKYTVSTDRGGRKVNPLIATYKSLYDSLLKAWAEMGLTPTAYQRLGGDLGGEGPAADLSNYLNGGG